MWTWAYLETTEDAPASIFNATISSWRSIFSESELIPGSLFLSSATDRGRILLFASKFMMAPPWRGWLRWSAIVLLDWESSLRFGHRAVAYIVLQACFACSSSRLDSAAARTDRSDEPWCLAATLPCPVFLEVVFTGLDTATAQIGDEADEAVENSVDEDAAAQQIAWSAHGYGREGISPDSRDKAIGHAVAKGDKGHDDE